MRFNFKQAALASTLLIAPTAFADTIVDGVNSVQGVLFVPPLVTSSAGNIQILSSGQIDSPTNGIIVDDSNRVITIDPQNTNGNIAIKTTAAAGDGILVDVLSPNAIITIGAGSNIQADGRGIAVASDFTKISNAATINAAGTDGVFFAAGKGLMTNETTGIINNHIRFSGTESSLTNFGKIFSGADAAVIFDNSFVKIENKFAATIDGVIGVELKAGKGTLENSGDILGGTQGIFLGPTFSGTIINNSTGLIKAIASDGIYFNDASANIFNAGTIEGNHGILLDNTANAGSITNSGTIYSPVFSAVRVNNNGSFTELVNSGTLKSDNLSIIIAFTNVSSTKGIVNSGEITNTSGGIAIDLQAGANVNVKLTQNGGSINGDIYLASAGGNIFEMTGGTVDGSVFTSLLASSTLNLNGGNITQPLTLAFGFNTVNLAGTILQNLTSAVGNDTINATGGTFDLFNGAPGDVLNVNATFTAGEINNVPTIIVNNDNTIFDANQPITGLSGQLIINQNTIMNANDDISGNGPVVNQGTLHLNNNILMNMTIGGSSSITNNSEMIIDNSAILRGGAFTQNPGGTVTIPIESETNVGQIQISGGAAVLSLGSFIRPVLATMSFIPDGTVFDIIQTPIGSVSDNSTLIQPSSPIVFFSKSGPNGVSCNGGANTCVELTLNRNALTTITGGSAAAHAVANTLDGLIALAPNIDPAFLTLIEQLQLLPTAQAVTQALESLASSFSYALIRSSQESMNNAFDSAQMRLEDLRRLRPVVPRLEESGANLGDGHFIYEGRGYYATWGKFYGSTITQKEREEIDGYKIEANGYAIGADWQYSPCAAYGIAGSYTTADATDSAFSNDSVDTKSMQATFYGWYEPRENVYLDYMLGLASHQYDTTRYISVGTLVGSPQAHFYGVQYGGQIEVGYAFLNDLIVDVMAATIQKYNFYFVPFARFKYTLLHIQDYNENNFNALNLSVKNNNITETIGGAGIRLAAGINTQDAYFVPEVDVGVFYDFNAQPQEMLSEFFGGGLPFSVNSATPGQWIELLSISLNAYLSPRYLISGKYNLELRDQFVGNNAYLLLRYTWD